MATKSEHVERTSGCYRSDALVSVVVESVEQLSSTVKGFKIRVTTPEVFSFKAGQWVDVHIPGVKEVGGYSITTDPHSYKLTGVFGLAIQFSDHPPTHWMHSQCQVGSELQVRSGGDFFYDPPCEEPSDLLLAAGGIGINPLISMLRHHTQLAASDPEHQKTVRLLYTSSSKEELLFKSDLKGYASSNVKVQFFVTQQSVSDNNTICRRIAVEDVKNAVQQFQGRHPQCFVCGPPPFISFIEDTLQSLSISNECIHYEKWW